jgi:tight adherence protein C
MSLPVIVFFSVTCGLFGLYFWLAPTRTDQRVDALSRQSRPDGSWRARVAAAVAPFAKLSTPDEAWENSRLRIRFLNAGIRSARAPLVFFGLKTVLPLLFATVCFGLLRAASSAGGMSLALAVLVAALAGCYLPNLALTLAARRRKRIIFEEFPDAADLLLVCVEAGMGLDAALTRVAEEVLPKCPALADELQLTNLEMRAGSTRESSLRNLALRTQVEELGSFATMLTQAERFGASVGDALRVFSDDLRHKRHIRAEEKAARIPTKMLFPLVIFIFPSVFLVVLGPAVIQIVRTIAPMLSGGT